jgi:hypothetical protein
MHLEDKWTLFRSTAIFGAKRDPLPTMHDARKLCSVIDSARSLKQVGIRFEDSGFTLFCECERKI